LESAHGAAELVSVPEGEGYDAKFNEVHLQAHNTYRKMHQACPMKFSADAARGAQEWANYLNDNKIFEHASNEVRKGMGENLAMNSRLELIQKTAIATSMWYNEIFIPYDDPTKGYDFSEAGNKFSSDYGHFTAIVWRGSSGLGCAVAGPYVVCRYTPAGNMGD